MTGQELSLNDRTINGDIYKESEGDLAKLGSPMKEYHKAGLTYHIKF